MPTRSYTARLSDSLRGLLAQGQGRADEADALRALILLGAHAAGFDLSGCEEDLLDLPTQRLDARLEDALSGVSCRRKTGARQVQDTQIDLHPPLALPVAVAPDAEPASVFDIGFSFDDD